MRDTLTALYNLQKIDSDVLEQQRSAEAIPNKITELEGTLEADRAELGELNSEVDTLKAEQQEVEARNAEESHKHRKWKSRLNDIKSPREYQALSRELELGERQVREGDERLMELMQEIEDKEKHIAAKAELLKGEEQKISVKVRELRSAQAKLEKEAQARSAGREELVKKLNPRMLKRYDQIRKKKQGLAVVMLKDSTCLGCNMRARPQQVVEILRFDRIDDCPNCRRILVHEDLIKNQSSPVSADS